MPSENSRKTQVEPDRPAVNPQIREFVSGCLRTRLGVGALPEFEVLACNPDFNPQALIEFAQAQRVAPLLYGVIPEDSGLPEVNAKRFREAYEQTAQVNLFYQHAFRQVLQAFAAEGIPVVVAKGAVLIEQIYYNPALRPLSDLDVYVRRADAPAAMDCLRAVGFQSSVEAYPGWALAFEKELLFHKAGVVEVLVDLHWDLFGSAYHRDWVPQDWLWEETVPVEVTGVPVKSWRLEVQILHLANHLLLHHAADADLLWWYDLAALIQTNLAAIQWDSVSTFGERLQVILPVRTSLEILRGEWGIAIPEEVLAQLQTLTPTPEETRLYAWHNQPDRSNAQRVWVDIRTLKGQRRRLMYILVRLFPTPAYLRSIFPVPRPVVFKYLAYWTRGLKMFFSMLASRTR